MMGTIICKLEYSFVESFYISLHNSLQYVDFFPQSLMKYTLS